MRRFALLATVFVVAVAACAPRGGGRSGAGRLSGQVTHRQRMALPPEAVVEVELIDVSTPGASRVLAVERVRTEGRQVPIPFALAYDPADVDPGGRQALRATIVVGDDVLFRSATATPVLAGGASAGDVELVVAPRRPATRASRQRVAADGKASLEGTHWRLVELYGKPIAAAGAGREPHVVLTSTEGRFAGSAGCNQVAGAYVVAGAGLRLRPVATTSMACPQGMEQERAFLAVLQAATAFAIDGNTLALLEGGRVIARFEAR